MENVTKTSDLVSMVRCRDCVEWYMKSGGIENGIECHFCHWLKIIRLVISIVLMEKGKMNSMNIEIKNNNAYEAVAEIIEKDILKRRKPYGTVIVWLWTSNLGYAIEVMDNNSNEGWYWYNDWYEGGEVKLLGYIMLEDIDIENSKDAVMFE